MKTLKSICQFSLAFLLIGLFIELFLSSAGILSQGFLIDKNKGERYIPNKTINTLFIMEGFGLSKSNSTGWLAKGYEKEKESDVSIAVLGNSFVASRQVFTRNHFLTLAEQKINTELTEYNTSILNFGKKNMYFGELLFIKDEIDSVISPDYTIVFLNERSFDTMSPNQMVPFFELSGDSLKKNTAFSESSKFNMYQKLGPISNSSLLYLAYRVKGRLKDTPEIIFDKFYTPQPNEEETNTEQKISTSPLQKTIIETLDKDPKVIFLLDMKEHNYLTIRSQIQNSPVISLRETLDSLKTIDEMGPYYWKISDENGHWNNAAHAVIGNTLADSLTKIIKRTNFVNQKNAN